MKAASLVSQVYAEAKMLLLFLLFFFRDRCGIASKSHVARGSSRDPVTYQLSAEFRTFCARAASRDACLKQHSTARGPFWEKSWYRDLGRAPRSLETAHATSGGNVHHMQSRPDTRGNPGPVLVSRAMEWGAFPRARRQQCRRNVPGATHQTVRHAEPITTASMLYCCTI